LNLQDQILFRASNVVGNQWNIDFTLHSTYEDAWTGANPWQCPNNSFNYGAGFTGECSPDGTRVRNQDGRFNSNAQLEVGYYVNKAESVGLEKLPSIVINGRGYAGGMALQGADGTIYMTGKGQDVWNNADDFTYLPEQASEDHTVTVNLSQVSTNWHSNWSKAGLMMRTDLDADSAYAFVFLSGSYGVCTQYRAAKGDGSRHYTCGGPNVNYAWLRMEKRMNVITTYYGTEDAEGNVAWTMQATMDLPNIGSSYNVGPAVMSQRWTENEAVFKELTSESYFYPSASPSYSAAPTVYVPGVDINANPGSTSLSATGVYTIKGAGWDIWNGADGLHYFKEMHSGDLDVTVLVNSFDVVHSWGKGGLMIRETLEPGSRHFSLFATGSNGVANQFRASTNGGSSHQGTNVKDIPIWLKISKIGNQFTAYFKKIDAADWQQVGATQTISFAEGQSFYVGLAVTSHDNNAIGTLVASDFNVIYAARKLRGGLQ
jgi:hypothetical protein